MIRFVRQRFQRFFMNDSCCLFIRIGSVFENCDMSKSESAFSVERLDIVFVADVCESGVNSGWVRQEIIDLCAEATPPRAVTEYTYDHSMVSAVEIVCPLVEPWNTRRRYT